VLGRVPDAGRKRNEVRVPASTGGLLRGVPARLLGPNGQAEWSKWATCPGRCDGAKLRTGQGVRGRGILIASTSLVDAAPRTTAPRPVAGWISLTAAKTWLGIEGGGGGHHHGLRAGRSGGHREAGLGALGRRAGWAGVRVDRGSTASPAAAEALRSFGAVGRAGAAGTAGSAGPGGALPRRTLVKRWRAGRLRPGDTRPIWSGPRVLRRFSRKARPAGSGSWPALLSLLPRFAVMLVVLSTAQRRSPVAFGRRRFCCWARPGGACGRGAHMLKSRRMVLRSPPFPYRQRAETRATSAGCDPSSRGSV